MVKIAIYGRSGVGKSTIASIISDYFRGMGKKVQIIKLAEPLYVIQNKIYSECAIKIGFYDQDQVLLTQIASIMRKIDKFSVVNNFLHRVEESADTDVIINDDIRDTDTDMPLLKKEGFNILHIICDEKIRLERLTRRKDISVVEEKAPNLEYSDYYIDTSENSYELMREQVLTICKNIMEKNARVQ